MGRPKKTEVPEISKTDRESCLKDCKRYFESLNPSCIDWQYCDKCHRLGYKCYNVCGVAMKVLINNNLITVSSNYGHESLVTEQEHIAAGCASENAEENYDDNNNMTDDYDRDDE